MTHAHAPEGAGRYDHADQEPGYFPTAHESALIEQLATQKVEERLYDSPEYFSDLMDGIDGSDYYGQLQRALANRERACKGERIAMDAVLTALTIIDRALRPAAEKAWLDECTEETQAEVLGTGDL